MSGVNAGTATGKTTETFITALITNSSFLAVELIAFTFLKNRLSRIYTPRTYLPPPDKRAAELPRGRWRWILAVATAPATDIIRKNGLDAYMFLRFLRLMIIIFGSFMVTTWVILLPINTVGIHSSAADGLNQLSWGNIPDREWKRYAAHIVLVYILTFWVIYLIRKECFHYTEMRQGYLTSKSHSHLPQARTVLLTSIPHDMCNEKDLRIWSSFVPGGVQNIWVYRDTKELNEAYSKRLNACNLLEAAEAKVLRYAIQEKLRRDQQPNRKSNSSSYTSQSGPESSTKFQREKETLDDLVPSVKRPRHRPGFLGLFGTKVDTIKYCKKREAKPLGSAFIQCNLQMGAHMAYKWIQVSPKDVIWDNIDDGVYETRFRYATSWMASFGIIVAWFFPVSFVGLLSNVSELCIKVKWLAWVCKAPTPVPGILQGVLPPLILAILFAVLPWILRGLAWYENLPLYSLLSISVYKRYYIFLVIHGFLVVTLSSGLTATAITQGLTGAGSALLQVFTLLVYYAKKWFFGRTPRQAYAVTFTMPSADFGVVLPQLSLLATIGLAYSVLSPIINGLAMLAFVLFYFVWKFLLTWVFDQPDEHETGGLYFPLAMKFLFVGLYIEQFCLAALFFLKSSSGQSFLVQGILMVLLLAITIGAQTFLSEAFDPLSNYLPMSLATKKIQAKIERHWRKEAGLEKGDNEAFDLFDREHIRSIVRKRLNAAKAAEAEISAEISFLKPVLTDTFDAIKEAASTHLDAGQSHSQQDLHPTISRESRRSGSSRRSRSRSASGSPHSHKSNRPTMAPAAPAPAVKYDDPDSSGDEDDFDDNGFQHPSSYAEQPWIWIPRDELGLSKYLVEELKVAGVDASDEGSIMDCEGDVEVTRSPPDEAWEGGHNA
ncbi:DUF221 family protein [Hysterangium stoloniferum]|nr:DUF221 family protein [Hysterangium stoloniferum]